MKTSFGKELPTALLAGMLPLASGTAEEIKGGR